MIRQRDLDRYFETVWAIAASQYVSEYIVGYTGRGGITRHKDYRRNGFEHLVILADWVTQSEARDLEGKLQRLIWQNPKHIVFRKYERRRRDNGHHYPSIGGRQIGTSLSKTHCVYMVWRE